MGVNDAPSNHLPPFSFSFSSSPPVWEEEEEEEEEEGEEEGRSKKTRLRGETQKGRRGLVIFFSISRKFAPESSNFFTKPEKKRR